MSIRKRIEGSRERRAQARAKRREQDRRAEQAKQAASSERRTRAGGRAKPKRAARPEQATPKPKRERVTRAAGPGPGPAPVRGRRSLTADARKAGGGVLSVGTELVKLAREMLVIPTQLWLAAAEAVGAVVLKAWLRVLRPACAWVWRATRACLRFADRQVTPARAVAVVAAVAGGALVASQWLDYHSVSVGIDAYAGDVGTIAPAPEVETEIAGNAHTWVMVPLGVAALVCLALALTGRRRIAVALVPIGLAVIAIAIAVDVPKGLDEGTAALAYQGASASLLEGFWLQLAAAVVLIFCGLMLPRYMRPQRTVQLTGPTLLDRLGAAARTAGRRRPAVRLPRPSRPRRKVEGAST